MSVRLDQRKPTRPELEAYNKAKKLTAHVLSVAKPKEENVNNKHVPKRFVSIGKMMTEIVVEMGADILEANKGYYVGTNLETETLIAHYDARIRLEERALKLTFRLEHIYCVLNDTVGFAESTNKYMLDLIDEQRAVLSNWIRSEKRKAKSLGSS